MTKKYKRVIIFIVIVISVLFFYPKISSYCSEPTPDQIHAATSSFGHADPILYCGYISCAGIIIPSDNSLIGKCIGLPLGDDGGESSNIDGYKENNHQHFLPISDFNLLF